MSDKKVCIYEIRNLTTRKKIDLKPAELAKFSSQEWFSKKITAEIDKLDSVPAETHDIQVKWGYKKEGSEKYKLVYRGVGGSFTYKDKKVTIKGLMDVSKLNMAFKGVLEVGPETKPEEERKAVARLSVRISNINKLQQWIIDLSHQEKNVDGSYINLKELLEWMKKKAPESIDKDKKDDELLEIADAEEVTDGVDDKDEPAELTPVEETEEEKPKAEDFIIKFKKFHFNITRKTFHIDVRSLSNDEIEELEEELEDAAGEDGEDDGATTTTKEVTVPEAEEKKKRNEITFGNFTISDLGFIITNEPFDYDDPIEDDEEEVEEGEDDEDEDGDEDAAKEAEGDGDEDEDEDEDGDEDGEGETETEGEGEEGKEAAKKDAGKDKEKGKEEKK